jgi:uncharacterized repeat protein (TIGR01451 family)
MKNRASLFHQTIVGILLFVLSAILTACSSHSLPLPTITSVSPSSAPAGGAGFTLKVMGTGFLDTDVVEWNGQVLATQPVSSTELDAQVPASLIAAAAQAKASLRLASLKQRHAQATPEQTGDVTVDITVLQKPPGSVVSNSFSFTITPSNPTPALAITKTHSGNFTQGQTGATFTITVSNAGNGPTDGSTVTATELPPSSLTVTAMTGTGWNCVLSSLTCTRNDALAADSSYPAITVTTSVATNAPATATNNVSISGGGSTPGTGSDMVTVTPPPTPALKITKTHTGNFTQGQTGATFTVTVSNTGTGPTGGTVTATDTPPAGLTISGLSGTGWTCTVTLGNCTRNDALAAGSSYPTIKVTVNVATNAPASVTNTVSISGGGSTSGSATDTVTVNTPAIPALSVTKTHTGNFTQGQMGATFTVTASNTGTGPTSGAVTVSDTAPTGLSITGISGTGWTCNVTTASCTRSDALAAGGTYPSITVTVNVATNAPASVTNTVSVSGGGSPTSASASDTVTVGPAPSPALKITKTHTGNFTQGQTGATFTVTVSNTGTGPTSGTVTASDTPPTGLAIVNLSGSGWTCNASMANCTRSDALAAGGSYPTITVTVNVATNAPASVTNIASASGGGSPAPTSASDMVTVNSVTPAPVLSITKTHIGNFNQGGTGAYTITVSNTGTGPTSGTVSVADNIPSGLTPVTLSGTGWTCSIGVTVGCSRSDALAGGSSYPAITLTVVVSTAAPSTVTNKVIVSNGSLTASANDPTTINPFSPTFTVTGTGPASAPYNNNVTVAVVVKNIGGSSTFGAVSVQFNPSSSLFVPVHLVGDPWSCTLGTLTCTRSDALASGQSYPPIYLTYQIGTGATSPFAVSATASGGGAVSSASTNISTPIINCSPTTGILCGQFALFTQGYTSSGPRGIAASFTADGAGHITAGIVDVNSMSAPQTGLSVLTSAPTGYSLESNSFGNLTLNTSAGSFVFKFIQNSVGNYANVIEYESSGTAGGSGFMIQQNPSYLAAGVTGSYAVAAIGGLGGASAGVRLGMIGAVDANGACGFAPSGSNGTINSGGAVSTAVNFSGALNPASCTVDPTTGRGTLSLTGITGSPAPPFSTANFVYYVYGAGLNGNAAALWLLSTDQTSTTHPLLSGVASLQSNAPYNTNAAIDCGVASNPSSSTGCVFASSGATGGNSISGNGHVAAGVAKVTTQSNTAGSMSLLLDDNKGGVVNSGTISATYSYAADGTGVITPSSGEAVAFVLTGTDSGITLGTGGSVAIGNFVAQTATNISTTSPEQFVAGTRFEATDTTTNTLANSTFTPSASPSNSGTITGNTRSWNSGSLQGSNTLSGTYSTAPLTGRGTGTTSASNGIAGAGAFSYYVINANSFVLIGTETSGAASGTPVLIWFQTP